MGVGFAEVRFVIFGRAELAQFLSDYIAALHSWLAGPEADNLTLTAEYIAFTCLRKAAGGT